MAVVGHNYPKNDRESGLSLPRGQTHVEIIKWPTKFDVVHPLAALKWTFKMIYFYSFAFFNCIFWVHWVECCRFHFMLLPSKVHLWLQFMQSTQGLFSLLEEHFQSPYHLRSLFVYMINYNSFPRIENLHDKSVIHRIMLATNIVSMSRYNS